MQVKRVLGIRLDLVGREEALDLIGKWLIAKAPRLKMVATAYSEFFVTARSDGDFRMALESSDLVVPDGIGPLAAINFTESLAPSDNVFQKVVKGVKTGGAILAGKVGQPVAGYWLFKELVKRAAENGWRIFLLGGFGDAASLVAEKLSPAGKIAFDQGAQIAEEMVGEVNESVVEKINKFRPDLLFVAYGPVKQEKWLAANKGRLKAKVAIGVGGTFDEFLGKVKAAPEVFSRLGLKWLWRLAVQPKRIGRIWQAVVVFPWLVFKESRGRQEVGPLDG
ncbi:MAG: WecB/TagA/CpsF family glycosyltransferase [Patescibacteria group bacterium]